MIDALGPRASVRKALGPRASVRKALGPPASVVRTRRLAAAASPYGSQMLKSKSPRPTAGKSRAP